MLQDILNNKPDITIQIDINAQRDSINQNNISTKAANFLNKRKKNMIHNFTFLVIDNKKGEIGQAKLEKNVENKIYAMHIISECFQVIEPKPYNVDMPNIKLALFNILGIFIKFIEEGEEINNLLDLHHEKKAFLCLYVLNLEILMYMNSGKYYLSVHLFKDNIADCNDEVNICLNYADVLRLPIFIAEALEGVSNAYDFTQVVFREVNEHLRLDLNKNNGNKYIYNLSIFSKFKKNRKLN